MSAADAFTTASPTFQAAQRGANRDRRTPISTPRTIVGDLGDPRSVPFDARAGRPYFTAVTILQLVVVAGLVACFWWALS